MEDKKIGIKIADGSFYPILDEGSTVKKRLVLTTVNDNQESVQIDLYRGSGETLEGATYIGSLMVDDIKPEAKGEAELELTMGIDEEGTLNSVATDRASGLKQSLSVGLKSLAEESLYDVPDFAFTGEEPSFEGEFEEDEDIFSEDFSLPEEEETPGDGEFDSFEYSGELETDEAFGVDSDAKASALPLEEAVREEAFEEAGFGEESSVEEQREGRKAKPLLVALLVILALALLGALFYLFVYMAGNEEAMPPLQARDGGAQEALSERSDAPEEAPVVSLEEESGTTGEATVANTSRTEGPLITGERRPSKDQVEFTGGVWYKIRWGDTLWQISSSFYDNPELYEKIADENAIPNPDKIFAEDSIFIPRQ